MSFSRLEWISTCIPLLKEVVQKRDGKLVLPLYLSSERLAHWASACLLWTSLGWADKNPFDTEEIDDAHPLVMQLRALNWQLPHRGGVYPILDLGGIPYMLTNRDLLESMAFTAQVDYMHKPGVRERLGSQIFSKFSAPENQPSYYLVLERACSRLGLQRETLLGICDLALNPPISLMGDAYNPATRDWIDLFPPWRFKKILELIMAEQSTFGEVGADFNAWANQISQQLKWPSFTSIK